MTAERRSLWSTDYFLKPRSLAIIILLGALGNVLGLLSIPLVPPLTISFTDLPLWIVAPTLGPIAGAITGALATIAATMRIGNVLIPVGGAIAGFVGGIIGMRVSKRPFVCMLVGVAARTPWAFFAVRVYGVPMQITQIILVNMWAENIVVGIIAELVLLRPEIRNLITID